MMPLVDTSVWIEHLRSNNTRLHELLYSSSVFCHPLVIGELACGHLKKRKEILRFLADLPQASIATDEEVMHLIESKKLYGLGLGLIDMHLLASCLLTKITLWTHDKRLWELTKKFKISYL